MRHETLWLTIGFVGQVLFFGRFVYQWLASERRRRSVIPMAFWLMSAGGGALLLVYAIHRRDPVFILGHLTGVFIYARNLWFIQARRVRSTTPAAPSP